MTMVRFPRLSLAEAEDVIAEIWKCLEEHDLQSPRMTFVFRRDGRVNINCRFEDALGAALIAWRFSDGPAGGELAPGHERCEAQAAAHHSPFSRGRCAGATH